MGANEPRSVANSDPRGMICKIYVGGHLILLHTKYLSSGPYGFSEEDFDFSHYKSMGANEPRGLANLDPRGMTGKIYIGDHLTLLHTNYLSYGPYGFREEDFSHYKSTGAIYCHGNQNSNPISPKMLCSLSPDLIMLHMKFYQDWPWSIRGILL